jgi:hypothetical protein
MYKVVDDTERLPKPKLMSRKTNRWDKIATLVNQDKTVYVEYKWVQALRDSLKRRGIFVHATRRGNGFVIWKKGE